MKFFRSALSDEWLNVDHIVSVAYLAHYPEDGEPVWIITAAMTDGRSIDITEVDYDGVGETADLCMAEIVAQIVEGHDA